MPLQDLTPQLRTRLNRVERAVGFFVTVATLALVLGLTYYIYHTARRKGWFTKKVEYQTGLNNAAGLKPGDPVKLMGFNVGEITRVLPNEPGAWYGVTVYFKILDPNFGYVWLDSKVRVAPADFLGNRNLEIIKGLEAPGTVLAENKVPVGVLNQSKVDSYLKEAKERVGREVKEENAGYNQHALQMEIAQRMTAETSKLYEAVRADHELGTNHYYLPLHEARAVWVEPQESPALTERLETLVSSLESSLPNIMQLTNQLSATLTNAAGATAQLNSLLAKADPIVTNLAVITGNLRDPKGSLGDWLIPTNLNSQLTTTLVTANATLSRVDNTLLNVNTNLGATFSNLNASLENVAGITSNLNVQVQNNSNILSGVSGAVTHSDELVQGLKRHWLLRSAFKTNTVDATKKASPPAPKSRK